jgi:hypothetical protein
MCWFAFYPAVLANMNPLRCEGFRLWARGRVMPRSARSVQPQRMLAQMSSPPRSNRVITIRPREATAAVRLYLGGMADATRLRIAAALSLTVVLTVASCSSSTSDTTTSSTEAPTVSVEDGGSVSDLDVAVAAMCRTLSLLDAAGVAPGPASVALTEVDQDGLTTSELAAYGAMLIEAPRSACPEHTALADEIAYWLGF